MASRLEWFAVTIPASTPVSAPVTLNTSFQAGGVSHLRFVVPPGPAGNVGFQLWTGGGQYWPKTPGQYLILDDDHPGWDVTDAPNTGSWSLVGYNTDINDHLIQVGFDVFENVANPATGSSIYVSV